MAFSHIYVADDNLCNILTCKNMRIMGSVVLNELYCNFWTYYFDGGADIPFRVVFRH